ncbi:hypothetical protein A3709_20730 [Halioglobus sp. HI00S01]|uniref:hypothetical protein n=1 Tax=Halioglobus sp. HI00S01 TaxID=1822214 RepID=UPI0007C36D53|nr:hypothetical protein [Halioglobus sp. HI00S01]KZX58040.1 hypothetical protein A3709_20730 [Halioglobus sp. HI00S01]
MNTESKRSMVVIDDRQIAFAIAAIRHFQHTVLDRDPAFVKAMFPHFGDVDPLSMEEANYLAEALNGSNLNLYTVTHSHQHGDSVYVAHSESPLSNSDEDVAWVVRQLGIDLESGESVLISEHQSCDIAVLPEMPEIIEEEGRPTCNQCGYTWSALTCESQWPQSCECWSAIDPASPALIL